MTTATPKLLTARLEKMNETDLSQVCDVLKRVPAYLLDYNGARVFGTHGHRLMHHDEKPVSPYLLASMVSYLPAQTLLTCDELELKLMVNLIGHTGEAIDQPKIDLKPHVHDTVSSQPQA